MAMMSDRQKKKKERSLIDTYIILYNIQIDLDSVKSF